MILILQNEISGRLRGVVWLPEEIDLQANDFLSYMDLCGKIGIKVTSTTVYADSITCESHSTLALAPQEQNMLCEYPEAYSVF